MLPVAIENLAENFRSFPGIGKKSSQKLALDILSLESEEYVSFLENIKKVKTRVKICEECGFFAEKKETDTPVLCEICKNKYRNKFQVCFVETQLDVLTLERSGIYNGRYHVLDKLISPLENIFPENTKLGDFFDKRMKPLIEELKVRNQLPQTSKQYIDKIELIVFFKAGFAAEATTAYIKEYLVQKNLDSKIKITKLAQGLPLYYNPETLDQATMAKALEDRREIF